LQVWHEVSWATTTKAIWDSSILSVPITWKFQGIALADTFYPDAAGVDGAVYHDGVNASWGTIRAAAGNGEDDTNDVGQHALIQAGSSAGNHFALFRGIYVFDTSAIDDGATINTAVFSLYVTSRDNSCSGAGSVNSKMVLVASEPTSNTALANGDFTKLGTVDFGRSVQQDSITDSAYNDITVNAAGLLKISSTSVTKFGTRYGWDFDNLDPWSNGATWAAGYCDNAITGNRSEHAGTSQDPKLVVTWTAPGSPTPTPLADDQLQLCMTTSIATLLITSVSSNLNFVHRDLRDALSMQMYLLAIGILVVFFWIGFKIARKTL